MIILSPPANIDEVQQLIARTENILTKWKGNQDYVRNLQIELFALHLLLDQIGGKDADSI